MRSQREVEIAVIDTREQEKQTSQWTFPEVSSVRRKLDFGDYSICGYLDGLFISLERLFAIERKTIQDAASTFTVHHDRFLAEVERARAAGATLVVIIEGRRRDFELRRYQGQNPPQAVLGAIESLHTRGVCVIFAGDALPSEEQRERIERAKSYGDREWWATTLQVYREQARDLCLRLLRYRWRHEVETIREASKLSA